MAKSIQSKNLKFINHGGGLHKTKPPAAQQQGNRLNLANLAYQGAFRLPATTFGESSIVQAAGAMAIDTDNPGRFFIAGRKDEGAVGSFLMPALVDNDADVSALNMASNVQPFQRLVDRATIQAGEGIIVSGLHYNNNRLQVNAYRFYDQSNYMTTPTLLFSDASDLASSQNSAYLSTDGGGCAGGWVSPVPASWQSRLGGTHISGMTTSTHRACPYTASSGPPAFAVNADQNLANWDSVSNISAQALCNFFPRAGNSIGGTYDNRYNSDGSNLIWTSYSEASFGFIVPGTDTYVVFGRSAGHLLINPSSLSPPGIVYGTPPGGYKGYYPAEPTDSYAFYWAYDCNDFLSVLSGAMQPHEVMPYDFGIFDAPFGVKNISGGAVDEAAGRVYLTCDYADTLQGSNAPVPAIAAYSWNGE